MIEDVKTGEERALALPIIPPRWSPDGRTIAGHTTVGPPVIATCPVNGAACRRLTAGRVPVWSSDGSRIYFLRDTETPSVKELWSMTPDGRDERKLFERAGPYREIDVRFDVSRKGDVVWSEYIEGRHELWQAILGL